MQENHLFETVGQALTFAYQFRASPKGAAIGAIPIGGGRGLIGLDGAAEAGNVKRMVDDLGKVSAAVLRARFGQKLVECDCCGADMADPDWRGACTLLALEVGLPAAGTTCHERLAIDLTVRHFAIHKRSLSDIAQRYGHGDDKVKKINSKLVKALKDVEAKVQASISERLIQSGLLPSVYQNAA